MKSESIMKTLMVVMLVAALGVTIKLAMDAQSAENARNADSELSPKEARRREIQGIIRQAINAHRQLDYETAEKLLVRASEQYPRVAAVWLNLGICYRSLNKLDAAERAFARVLELNADDWDAIAERATIRLMRGELDEAVAMLSKVPANKGQVYERLRADPLWTAHKDDARLQPLLEKHRVVSSGETSQRQAAEIIKAQQGHRQAERGSPSSDQPAAKPASAPAPSPQP